jgi:hypothetical protein
VEQAQVCCLVVRAQASDAVSMWSKSQHTSVPEMSGGMQALSSGQSNRLLQLCKHFNGLVTLGGAHTSMPYVMQGLMTVSMIWSFVAMSRSGFLRTCFHESECS